ncbi:MAG: Maf family protein [Pseudomonadales bacterium]
MIHDGVFSHLPATGVLLASASPRRVQLLEQMGLRAVSAPMEIDESIRSGEDPGEYVARMSTSKCRAALEHGAIWLQERPTERVLLAADTIVVAGGAILGKPASDRAAADMLRSLSNTTHQVMTSVTAHAGVARQSVLSVAKVRFKSLTEQDIAAYVDSGEGRDKAGGYGIQGIGGIFVEHISGSYSAVVGLPIAAVEQLLVDLGIDTWRLRGYG